MPHVDRCHQGDRRPCPAHWAVVRRSCPGCPRPRSVRVSSTRAWTRSSSPICLSACLAHERCGMHLYRSVAGRTTDAGPAGPLRAVRGGDTQHVAMLEELVSAAGGDPMYVSAAARATEKAGAGLVESTFLLDGSVDPVTAELAMLEAVMLAEAKDHGNWELLAQMAAQCRRRRAHPVRGGRPTRCSPKRRSTTAGPRDTRAEMLIGVGHRRRRPAHASSRQRIDLAHDPRRAVCTRHRSSTSKDDPR